MSISHALAVADALRERIVTGAADPENLATTPEEIRAGRIAHAKAKEALGSTIALIDQTLSSIRSKEYKAPSGAKPVPKPTSLEDIRAKQLGDGAAAPSGNASDAQKVVNGMSADSMKTSTQSLQGMATAIGPIVEQFDSILTEPYLNQYSATLNTVPVVGIKNNQLMYIQTTEKLGGLVDAWSTFSSLPPNATINPGDVVHIFPYKGDFCMSIGKTVWKKVHLGSQDPNIKNAVDNWPALYSQGWTALGDCLPLANFAGVIPFAVLSADRTQLNFQLVTLDTEGTLSYLTSDQLTPEGKWQNLTYQAASGGVVTAPTLTKIAYWNNTIVGIDGSSNTWTLTVSFQNGTYSVADQTAIEPVTEFTATDAGPVGLRSDGYLWKRIITPTPDGDSSKDPVLEWQRWIQVEGVVNIGVASPGVILDMNLLTTTLKSRYIDVQTAVYPVVEKIKAYSTTHIFFLNNVMKDAEDYANATTDDQKALAIKNAKSFIAHAQTWSTIISNSIGACQSTVTVMTSQLHDVRMQLDAQLVLLKNKLTMLNATLSAQEDAMSKLKAAFWGSIAASLFGLALIIIGAVTASPWVIAAGGALMVGGVVAACVLSSKMSALAGDIADTESQITTVTTAITEMTSIVNCFSNLDTIYGTLNTFWGRLSNDASNVKDMDDATAIMVGAGILEDTSSIQAALSVTTDMGKACTTYLDVLNKQGVIIPSDSLSVSKAVSLFTQPGSAPESLRGSLRRGGLSLTPVFKTAQNALSAGDVDGYHKVMKFATLLDMSATAGTALATTATGLWFDVAALQSSSSVWLSSSSTFLSASGIYNAHSLSASNTTSLVGSANDLDSILNQIKPSLVSSLDDIIAMASTIVEWIQQFPKPPTNADDIAKLQQYQASAIKSCESAQSTAAAANNLFADFNHKATDYQQGLEAQIASTNNAITAANAKCASDLSSLSPPWYVDLGGPAAILIWKGVEEGKIRDACNSAIDNLAGQINDLKGLISSGTSFNGHAATWIEFSQAISGDLGTVHNLLTGVWGQIYEDPVLYNSLISGEWAQLVQNAKDVLAILGNSAAKVELWAIPREKILATTANLKMAAVGPEPSTDSHRIVLAVSPDVNLGSSIMAQSEGASTFFYSLDLLLKLPYTKEIVGSWDSSKTDRQTLYDVSVGLRNEYVNMIAMEYNAILRLQSLALLQDYRAGNVAAGKLSVETFVKATLLSVKAALEVTEGAHDKFKDSAQRFSAVLNVIDANIASIETQISDLDDKIDTLEDQERDKIISIVADTIAIAFAGAIVLAAFGMIGPVGAAVALGVQIGASAGAVAASVKTVLDSLSLSDLIKVIQALKSTRTALSEGVEELKTVQPLFKGVVNGVTSLNDVVNTMEASLTKLLQDVNFGNNIAFTQEDAVGVQAAWAQVRECTQIWLDTINRQGIVPEAA